MIEDTLQRKMKKILRFGVVFGFDAFCLIFVVTLCHAES